MSRSFSTLRKWRTILRKHGGFMPGIRPGRATAEYLNSILTRLTIVGAVYLALVAFVPQFMLSGFKVARLPSDWHLARLLCQQHARSVLDPNRHGLSVLFRWHFAADSCGRGDGYCGTNRSAVGDAQLRRIPRQWRSIARTESVTHCRLAIADCRLEGNQSTSSLIGNWKLNFLYAENDSVDGSAWCWQRYAGAFASGETASSANLDRGYPASQGTGTRRVGGRDSHGAGGW